MKSLLTLSCLVLSLTSFGQQWSEKKNDGFSVITNPKGQIIGYSLSSGVKILTVDGLAFKDLNKNGSLDKYEDWRLPVDERAKDLASKMSVEQIAGLNALQRASIYSCAIKRIWRWNLQWKTNWRKWRTHFRSV